MIANVNYILVLLSLLAGGFCQVLVTKKGVKAATDACRTVIDNKIPDFTRTIFHDCVGGCNGCIDIDNPGNAGEYNYKSMLHC